MRTLGPGTLVMTLFLTACGGGAHVTGAASGGVKQTAQGIVQEPSSAARSFWVDSERSLLLDLVRTATLPPQAELAIPSNAETWEANFQYGDDGCRAYVTFWSAPAPSAVDAARPPLEHFVQISNAEALSLSTDPAVDRAPRNCDFLLGRHRLSTRTESRLEFCGGSSAATGTAKAHRPCYRFVPVRVGPSSAL